MQSTDMNINAALQVQFHAYILLPALTFLCKFVIISVVQSSVISSAQLAFAVDRPALHQFKDTLRQ